MSAADYNIIAMVGGAVVTGLVGYTVHRFSKISDARFDARAQAEAALIGIGPQIIKEQNDRIDRLNERIDAQSTMVDTLWRRERECREELNKTNGDMRSLDRRYQRFVSSLLMQMTALRRLLRNAGTQLPPISGLDIFVDEGGTPRDEWTRTIKEEGE